MFLWRSTILRYNPPKKCLTNVGCLTFTSPHVTGLMQDNIHCDLHYLLSVHMISGAWGSVVVKTLRY